MKISLQTGPFIAQDTGLPIEGRLSVYLINTDVLARTYTYEGNNGFVECVNPMLLHGGMPDESVFVDAGLYGLKIEKYTGPEGQMSAESPDTYFEQTDYLECGLDYDPSTLTNSTVDTIEDLQDCDPALGTVTVLWHTTQGDCTPRTYVWDSGSRDQIDGGYVVGSNVSDTGNWILVWGDEILPCTFYGVIPGREENINLLLNYPATVGSFHLVTAPCVRFIPGTYTTNTNFFTDKEIVVDGGATFPSAYIECPRMRVIGKATTYVGDFGITGTGAEAHSSWFKTPGGFWRCGAQNLILDSTNYFASTQISGSISLANKTIIGNQRLNATYASGAYLQIESTTTIVGRVFSGSDFLKIVSGHGDEMFTTSGTWDPGTIANGHHVEYSTVPDLDLFENATRWVAVMVERRARFSAQAWQSFMLDLQCRRVSSLNVGLFRDIRNAYCDTISVSNSDNDIVFRNVHATSAYVTCKTLSVYDSSLSFTTEPSAIGIYLYDSRIDADNQWTSKTCGVIAERCYIGVPFNRVSDNVNRDAVLRFTECNFKTNVGIYSKNLEMYRCTTSNNAIKVYPYLENGSYKLFVRLENNSFNNNYAIELTKLDTVNGALDENCYDCILNVVILGNQFSGNENGITMRYWQNRSGQYWTRTFIAQSSLDHNIAYAGNTGNCPAESMRGAYIGNTASGYQTTDLGSGNTLYRYTATATRCFSAFTSGTWWRLNTVKGDETLVKYYGGSEGSDAYVGVLYTVLPMLFYQLSYLDNETNGDAFLMGVGAWNGPITVPTHATGVLAKVV